MQGKNMLYSYSVAAAIVRIQRRAAVSTADTCMGYTVMPLTAFLAEPFSHANFHAGLGSSCVFVYNIEYNQTEDICQCFTPLKLIVLCEGMLQLWSKFYSSATAVHYQNPETPDFQGLFGIASSNLLPIYYF